MNDSQHIDTTRPHTRLRPFSPSGFTTDIGQNTTDGGVLEREKESNNSHTLSPNANENRERERNIALSMMRERGIELPEKFIDLAPAPAIIGACRWADQRGAGAGLLIWKIREGGVTDTTGPRRVSKQDELKLVFDRYVEQHPVDSRLCSHMALAARKWPDDQETCPGQMIVVVASYPVMEIECDSCGFDAALTPRMMKGNV